MKKILLVIFSFVFLGCQADPFPTGGKIQEAPGADPKPILAPYGLKVPAVMEFVEGVPSEYMIESWVPAPGVAQLEISGLPEGAVYNSETKMISWTPPYDAANDPSDGNIKMRSYPIHVTLTSGADTKVAYQSSGTLLVKDSARPMNIIADTASLSSKEGETKELDIKIECEDYPNGPFDLYLSGLPTTATVAKIKGTTNQYKLTYTADYEVVKRRYSGDQVNDSKDLDVKLVAVSPNSIRTELDFKWNIQDARLNPIVSAPTELTQGPDVNFLIRVDDPNGESEPTLRAPGISTGQFKVTKVESGATFQISQVSWTQIPESEFGKTKTLNFESCVYGDLSSLCKTIPVKVTLGGTTFPLPVIDRTAWPLGKTMFIKEGDKSTYTIPVRMSDSSWNKPAVTIEPTELQSEIKYNSSLNWIEITPNSSGVKQFNLIAKSSTTGARIQESFIYEALPKDWASVLVLGDSLRDPDLKNVISRISSVQVVNPMMQPLDSRTLALRTTVVASTNLLSDKTTLESVDVAAKAIKNVVLMSPLISETLKGSKILTELADLGATFVGRFNDLKPPALPAFQVDLADKSPLAAPTGKMTLRGSLTNESSNPLILNDLALTSKCVSQLDLVKKKGGPADPEIRLGLGVSCKRKTGGKIVVFGTEIGDLSTSTDDMELPKKWLGEWVK